MSKIMQCKSRQKVVVVVGGGRGELKSIIVEVVV